MSNFTWGNMKQDLTSRSFTCGHCSKPIASKDGYPGTQGVIASPQSGRRQFQCNIYICHFCGRPNFFDADDRQVPSPPLGQPVRHLGEKVELIYEEARRCTSAGAFTAAAMCCRKVLMNTAVDKGADTGKSFASYLDYLKNQHLIASGSEAWVDKIREMGNVAAHEIPEIKPDDAKLILRFTEMLLKTVYEFPGEMMPPVNVKPKD